MLFLGNPFPIFSLFFFGKGSLGFVLGGGEGIVKLVVIRLISYNYSGIEGMK